jgi:DNA-binding NtrC family response regulator
MGNNFDDHNIFELLRIKFGIVGQSDKMLDVVQRLLQAAPTDLSILITGETGTGKEVFANAIHGLSKRSKFPFVSVNCGAIPETLLESELFGHEKGAFTGAIEQRKGFFEVADNGTIFLDEIGEMPVGTQVKLLRVLESGEFMRLGSSKKKRVDVRVVAATNRELENEIINGNFRQDLYFRLKSVHLLLPPLREHIGDIPLLVDFFANKIAEANRMKYEGISNEAIRILQNLPWHGNVRELRNLIETIMVLEERSYIEAKDVKQYIPPALSAPSIAENDPQSALVPYKNYQEPEKFELELIFRTLLEMKNDISDIKRYLYNMNINYEEIKDEISKIRDEAIPTIHQEDVVTIIDDEDLNLEDAEKRLMINALDRFEGNRRKAAEALGISERTLYRKLSDYGLNDQ